MVRPIFRMPLIISVLAAVAAAVPVNDLNAQSASEPSQSLSSQRAGGPATLGGGTSGPAPGATTFSRQDDLMPVTGLIGSAVRNLEGEHLGTIRDVVFGGRDGHVRAVVALGPRQDGLAGWRSGQEAVAVPMTAFRLTPEGWLVVNGTADQMASLPRVEVPAGNTQVAEDPRLMVPERHSGPLAVLRPE